MYKQSQGVEPGCLIELGNPACGQSVDMHDFGNSECQIIPVPCYTCLKVVSHFFQNLKSILLIITS